MATPTAPTAATLVDEGLKKAGHGSPAAALKTRAKDEWLEEIKNDIWFVAKKVLSLQKLAVMIMAKGKARYAMPTDFSSDLTLTLMTGEDSGTAQGGSLSTLTVASNSTFGETDIQGKEVVIDAGTGKGSFSQVTAYNTTTNVVTVSPDFDTSPSSDSTYTFIDTYYQLTQNPIWNLEAESSQTTRERPTAYFPLGDADDGELRFYPTPDKTYAVKLRYYADLMRLDLTSNLLATVYRRWRGVFIQGVYSKALQSMDDNRAPSEYQLYRSMITTLIARERYGMDLSNLKMQVGDYA